MESLYGLVFGLYKEIMISFPKLGNQKLIYGTYHGTKNFRIRVITYLSWKKL